MQRTTDVLLKCSKHRLAWWRRLSSSAIFSSSFWQLLCRLEKLMRGNLLIIWLLIAGRLHPVIHSKCIGHLMSLDACPCVTTKMDVQKAFTTMTGDRVSWRWTVAKNGKKTTVGKRYCRQGKTSFCLTRYLKDSNGCHIVFKVFRIYSNFIVLMPLDFVHDCRFIVFSPDKIVQACLAVLLYGLLSRPRLVIFHVYFMLFCLFLFYFPSLYLLRFLF